MLFLAVEPRRHRSPSYARYYSVVRAAAASAVPSASGSVGYYAFRYFPHRSSVLRRPKADTRGLSKSPATTVACRHPACPQYFTLDGGGTADRDQGPRSVSLTGGSASRCRECPQISFGARGGPGALASVAFRSSGRAYSDEARKVANLFRVPFNPPVKGVSG